MRWLILTLLLMFPFASATDIGGFTLDYEGNIIGTYTHAGLEGTISCFVKEEHIMDITYKNDSIELSIHFFASLDKIVERNPFLKDELERALRNKRYLLLISLAPHHLIWGMKAAL